MNFSKAIARTEPGFNAQASRPWLGHVPLALLLLSLVVLYAPTAWSLAHSLWQDDTHSHGPLVLLAVVWLFWRGIRAHAQEATPQPSTAAGVVALGLGLLIYVLGRSQGLYVLEVGSAIPVVLGGVLLTWGAPLARKLWFAFVFLLFLVPLPGSLIDTITQPMKLAVSWAAEHLMHAAGYPVARAGVVLGIGPYQLFVADACAGLNSLFMLEAFGLLYLNVVRHESALRNAVLAVLIVPISFVANVLRVVVLALVTFHFGDAAGQGFIHSFSGVVLFGVALALTVGADTVVRLFVNRQSGVQTDGEAVLGHQSRAAAALRVGWTAPSSGLIGAVVSASIACAGVSHVLAPSPARVDPALDLSAMLPSELGEWKSIDLPYEQVDVVPKEPGAKNIDRPYDQSVTRAYINREGQVVALVIAYAANQTQEVKLHQPELCYQAQGFVVVDRRQRRLATESGFTSPIDAIQLEVSSPAGGEAITYWLRVGQRFSANGFVTRLHLFWQGLQQRSVDGVLLRASMRIGSSQEVKAANLVVETFLRQLTLNVPPKLRSMLLAPGLQEAS